MSIMSDAVSAMREATQEIVRLRALNAELVAMLRNARDEIHNPGSYSYHCARVGDFEADICARIDGTLFRAGGQ